MVIFLLSLVCGHCVHRAVVMGSDEYYAAKREAASRPCPLCGARATEDEFQVVAPSEGVEAAREGRVPWNRPRSRPDRFFAGFGDAGAAQPFRRGAFAESLRRQVRDEALSLRTSDYQALSKAFQSLYGLQLGIEAFQAGDPSRALVWLEQTVEVLQDPADLAFAYAHIGLARDSLGDVDAAVAAFRSVHRRPGAAPALRGVAAYYLGVHAESTGRRDESRRLFAEATRDAPPELAAQARRRLSGRPR